MIDIKYIKENLNEVKDNVKNRNAKCDVDLALSLYEEKLKLTTKVENLRKNRNANASLLKQKLEQDQKEKILSEGKKIKEELAKYDAILNSLENDFLAEMKKIPNLSHVDTPLGADEKDSVELYRVGEIKNKSFKIKNHEELGESLDLIDFKSGAKTTGQKFYFLKNQAVFLELALVRYATDIIKKRGFTPYITPDLARGEVLEGLGFHSRGDESNVYKLEDTNLNLIATAEITLGGIYANTTIDAKDLPIKMGGISHCFRKESGAAGQFSKGLYRVHQFTKVEMFVISTPEDSDKILEELLKVEEEIFKGLNIAYRVIDTPRGDLGAPAYRKYDIEAFMPCRGKNGDYGEITSASNCTDYQARNLNIRYKSKDKKGFAHTLNGTAIAIPRVIVSILENHQNEDGSVSIPEVLIPYTGFDKISKAK